MTITKLTVDAVLFDMDGTLVDSTEGVVGAWETFAQTYVGLDVCTILNTSHGVRTIENLRKFCGIEDPKKLETEACRFEQAIVDSSQKNGRKGIVQLPGVRHIMEELLPGSKYPKPCWAICTSATAKYAASALNIAGVPVPDVMIVAEDVSHGKPAPDPYLLGAQKCGVSPERCLVVEDAPAGVRSGQAAGCQTLALCTSHSREQMLTAEAEFLVQDLSWVSMRRTNDGVEVTINTDGKL